MKKFFNFFMQMKIHFLIYLLFYSIFQIRDIIDEDDGDEFEEENDEEREEESGKEEEDDNPVNDSFHAVGGTILEEWMKLVPHLVGCV